MGHVTIGEADRAMAI